MAGGFASGGKGDAGDVEIGARLMELGEDALADLTGFIGGAFGEQDDNLAEFLIGTLGNYIRYAHVGTELTLEFLSLNLQASGADDVVFSSDNPKFRKIRRSFSNIIGDESFRTDLRGVDDETALV